MKRIQLDYDAELLLGYRMRMAELDKAHARATTPKQRLRIEREMTDINSELEDIIAKGKVVDLAFERWVRTLSRHIEQ